MPKKNCNFALYNRKIEEDMAKYNILRFFILILLCVSGCLSAFADDQFVLVIDPGHGGKDSGAVGKKGKEKNINLAVSKYVGDYIAAKHPDIKIVFTRKTDVFIGLDDRANIANKANANLFISIHTNSVANKSSVSGAEVYTFGISRTAENLEAAKRENAVIMLEDNYEQKYEGFDPNSDESYIIFEFMQNKFVEQSIDFASLVQNELVKTAGRKDRGVRQAAYLVLRKSTMPRILVELDFISNAAAEEYLLSEAGQKKLARAISNAFSEYKKNFDKKNNSAETAPKQDSVKQQPTDSETTQPAATSGRVYKVQIIASAKKLTKKELNGYDADYYYENKLYKYTVGESSDWNEINELQKKVTKDFKTAFIVTFENGKKVPNPK